MDHLHWRHLLAKLSATATHISTFLGYLGWHDTDRIISIYVMPSKVANSSTMVTVTCHCHQHYRRLYCAKFANVKTA